MMGMAAVDNEHYPMIHIPSGVVDMRDDRTKRTWQTEISSFLLAPVPVTRRLYESITRRTVDEHIPLEAPVVNVSWLDAVSFCNEMSIANGLTPCYSNIEDEEAVLCNWQVDGYRLPTEAEWQYACKAETTGYRYGELADIAWYRDNSSEQLHPVGQKQPNTWGLYDMLGNVWEWCWDLYDVEVYGSYRIFRGGSWAEEARGCGATTRRRSHPTFRIDDLGFRLARSL